jgi:hypothetical protein
MDQNEQVDGHAVGPSMARSQAHPLRLTPGLAEERRAESPHEGAAVAVLVGLLLLAIFVAAALVGVLAQTVAVLVALATAYAALSLLRTRVIAQRTQLSGAIRRLAGAAFRGLQRQTSLGEPMAGTGETPMAVDTSSVRLRT